MGTLVETIHGRYSKFTIYRDTDFLGRTIFYVHKDGKSWYTCSTLSHAVEHIRSRD